MNKKAPLNIQNPLVLKNSQDITNLVEKKLNFFQDVIQKTILNAQKNKMLDILGVSDMATCINTLNNISERMKSISDGVLTLPTDTIVSNLQVLNNELSSLLKSYGTESFDDLLSICFGNSSKLANEDKEIDDDELY